MKIKIFYTAGSHKKGEFTDTQLKIYDFLVGKGYDVQKNLLDFYTEDQTADAFTVLTHIKEADIFIGEMSIPSQTLGFQLSYAIMHNKPSLYLYHERTLGKPKSPLFGNPSRLITIKSYNDKNFEEVLLKFLKKAEKQLLSDRITFVATKKITEFIDQTSLKMGLSKGEIIRGIIENAIEEGK